MPEVEMIGGLTQAGSSIDTHSVAEDCPTAQGTAHD
jgi:hypothetical protein